MRKLILVAAFGLLMLGVPASAHHANNPVNDCSTFSASNILHFGAQDNTWTGDADHECVDGLAGHDDLDAVGGDDALWGGPGNDVLRGGTGFDNMTGGGGGDSLFGEGFTDVLYGDVGDDILKGGGGPDSLFGGGFCNATDHYAFDSYPEYDVTDIPCGWGGADILRGEDGDDWLWESNSDTQGDNEVDYLYGGEGYDICTFEAIDVASGCEEQHIVP